MSEHHERVLFPFSAIVGQERMKTALMLNAINPGIGGVLIKGVTSVIFPPFTYAHAITSPETLSAV